MGFVVEGDIPLSVTAAAASVGGAARRLAAG
jgi:hypothetical protein